jgi:hypothetical protein
VEQVNAPIAAAQRSAHNVQEARFCAITTARVNAIARRWQPGSLADLLITVERFATDPFAAEFSALHLVGEQYTQRSAGRNMLEIPAASRAARSLQEIATEVYGMPLARFESVNPGDPYVSLELGTEINVPVVGFVPILASRLAAEVLGRREEVGDRAIELIAKLVPTAAGSPTALDLVLARLLLAAQPLDAAAVGQIGTMAPDEWMKSPMPNRNGRGMNSDPRLGNAVGRDLHFGTRSDLA